MGDGPNYGIQNNNSIVNGPQAAGPGAAAGQTVNQAVNASADAAELAAAVDALREELVRLRWARPPIVSELKAAQADLALLEAKDLAVGPNPNHRALRDRVHVITAALSDTSALSTALATLVAAAGKLTGTF